MENQKRIPKKGDHIYVANLDSIGVIMEVNFSREQPICIMLLNERIFFAKEIDGVYLQYNDARSNQGWWSPQ